MSKKHTPMPWKVDTENRQLITYCGIGIAKALDNCGTREETEANTAFIVRACNNFERVRAALDNLSSDVRALKTREDLQTAVDRVGSWFSVIASDRVLRAAEED